MFKLYIIAIAGILLTQISLEARPWRPGQIPNGDVNNCSNCHINPAGGGPRNLFGQEVEANYLDNEGNVMWGPMLAMIDSDGDGFTNGEELLDPEGAWSIGEPAPGNPENAGHPGNDQITPNITFAEDIQLSLDEFSVYPNPAAVKVSIRLEAEKYALTDIEIYNSLGQKIWGQKISHSGAQEISWNLRDFSGSLVPAGTYIVAAGSEDRFTLRKIQVVR